MTAVEIDYGYGGVRNVEYMKRNVRANDLVWTRDTVGIYYLARVESPWEYLATEESLQADIVNFVRCQIFCLELDEVPGKVVACFRAPRTIQAIRDRTVATYSKMLWNLHSRTQHYSLEDRPVSDIYAFLDDKSTEDAVAIYLQAKGWFIVPGSRKADTMSYEYILIHKETSARAIVQVKTGNSSLNRDEWSVIASGLTHTSGEVQAILFQSYGKYTGSEHSNVKCISPDDLRGFIFQNRSLLPRLIAHWRDFVLAGDTTLE